MLKLGELPKNAKELNEFLFSDFFKLNFNKSTIITSIYNLKKPSRQYGFVWKENNSLAIFK